MNELFNWRETKDRIEEARQRRKHRCHICGRLMELGHGCVSDRWNKTTGQFDHEPIFGGVEKTARNCNEIEACAGTIVPLACTMAREIPALSDQIK